MGFSPSLKVPMRPLHRAAWETQFTRMVLSASLKRRGGGSKGVGGVLTPTLLVLSSGRR